MTSARTFVLLATLLVAAFLASLWCQRNVGLADNTDFLRSAGTFTSGPVGLPPGEFPAEGTELHRQRLFNYWLPRWNLRWSPHHRPNSSVDVLWLPGVLAASASKVVDLRVVSLFPKGLLLGELLVLVLWTWRQPAALRLALLASLGIPAVLLFTATDYLAYLQSFYQESASLVFVPALFCSLVWFYRRPDWGRLAVTLVCLGLVCTAKRSNVYWPPLVFPLLTGIWLVRGPGPGAGGRRVWQAAVGALGCVVFVEASLVATHLGGKANVYDSLFYGALTFSKHPGTHLQRLGRASAAECVGVSAYVPTGTRYLAAHYDDLTYRDVLLTYAREPGAVGSAAGDVLANMQDVSLEYLGKYAPGDPRVVPVTPPAVSVGTRYWGAGSASNIWNWWSALKYRCFPTGGALALCLAAFAGWFAWRLRASSGSSSAGRELALVGLVAVPACVADMAVAILGDGRYELIKHLFLANLLFDLAAIVFLSSVAVSIAERRLVDTGANLSLPQDKPDPDHVR